MKDYEFVFDDDKLYFEKIIERLDNGGTLSEMKLIISKEVFQECYKRWILNEDNDEGL